MASIFLNGIALANFRGFGENMVRIVPFKEINFFAGPNNSGKSSLLHFIHTYLPSPASQDDKWNIVFDPLDVAIENKTIPVRFSIAADPNELLTRIAPELGGQPETGYAEKIVDALTVDGWLWLEPTENGRGLQLQVESMAQIESLLTQQQWHALSSRLKVGSYGDAHHAAPLCIFKLGLKVEYKLPKARFVPAIRQITKSDTFGDFTGAGLIKELSKLQSPEFSLLHTTSQFEKINKFLREVTGDRTAQIQVPHTLEYLIVKMNEKSLPLNSLGTGIHEVIMLAVFCTITNNEIICLEEPEIHLHPILQRKLIKYLRDNTDNQYFIATHSASLLDGASASIFSVSLLEGMSVFKLASSPGERFEVCRQLGYHASDLLQANAVIWVEGPSDRIYLNYWLRAVAPDLQEGIHYSIMFYGGRLLSHLTADDSEVSEFISLRRLNQNSMILIDSDKRSQGGRINATKSRVAQEFGGVLAWVTKGREIENYVPAAQIEEAVRANHPKIVGKFVPSGPFESRLHFVHARTNALYSDADKVKVATFISRFPADLSALDLRRRLVYLERFIRDANAFN